MTLAHPNRNDMVDRRTAAAGPLPERPGAGARIKIHGDLDCFTSHRLTQSMTTVLLDRPRMVTVDLSAVSFLDSAGLGAIIDSHRQAQAQGCQLVLRGTTGVVRRVLDMTGVSAQVTLVDP